MDRRQFLLHAPAALAGGAVHALTGTSSASLIDPDLERRLLEQAGRHYLAMVGVNGCWWRFDEIEVEAKALNEALAEVWCRRRGLNELPAQRPWSHIASWRPDERTGVPWRALHSAICRLHSRANQLNRWDAVAKRKGERVSYQSIHDASRDVAAVVALAADCMEALRSTS